ncbi:MAG: hypothetical protein H7A46_11140 [Verrucomicrobiales bacterium]|nr:hypothetical protein [Verrucomicrobiales bacterium]
MGVTVELDLTEAEAERARVRGLLEPASLTRLIHRELEASDDSRDFYTMSRELRELPGEPMSLETIQRIVDEIRAERTSNEAGH